MQIKKFDVKGKEIGQVKTSDIKKKPKENLIYILNRIVNLSTLQSSHTKTRSERRGGGAKPWRQKGTGRARVGSIRSPLWRKGGVVFGPRREKNYQRRINRRSAKIARTYLLGEKMNLGEVIIWKIKPRQAPLKTKEAEKMLLKLPVREGRLLMLIDEKESFPGFYNIVYLDIKNVKNISSQDPFKYKVIIFTEKAFANFNPKKKKNAKDKN